VLFFLILFLGPRLQFSVTTLFHGGMAAIYMGIAAWSFALFLKLRSPSLRLLHASIFVLGCLIVGNMGLATMDPAMGGVLPHTVSTFLVLTFTVLVVVWLLVDARQRLTSHSRD
jgi:hypothetical protein